MQSIGHAQNGRLALERGEDVAIGLLRIQYKESFKHEVKVPDARCPGVFMVNAFRIHVFRSGTADPISRS